MTESQDQNTMNADHAPTGDANSGSAPAVHAVIDPTHHFEPKPEDAVFDDAVTFESLGLRGSVLKGLQEAGFSKPTTIQAKLIPVALTGKDVLGQAKTGTGKTAAFGLPLIHLCSRDVPFQALILAPTRELAIQITEEINKLAKHTPIRAVTLYGGQSVQAQASKLKSANQILVGTPGRVMDMIERGLIHLKNIRFAVLDEVDRMFDIGFRDDIQKILGMCPKPGIPPEGRQTIFVSATIAGEVEKLARKHMYEPEKIITSAGSLTVSLVKQFHLTVQPWDKSKLLIHLLTHEEPALTLVFCRLKRTVDDLCRRLMEKGVEAHAMHGDMSQGKRNSTMKQLRSGKMSVLICSDLASRGIDVEGVSHVINYDLPDDPDLYVHRIGRTARAGRGGIAWSLVTPDQGGLLTEIEMLVNTEIPKLDYPDFKPTPRPANWRDQGPGGRREGGLQIVRSDGSVSAPGETSAPAAPKVNRVQAAISKELPASSADKVDLSKFPGGIVPTKMPPKRMFGKMPGRGR